MEGYSEELIRIRGILRASPHGMSVTEIARTLGRNKHSVGRYMDILLVSGHVEMRMYGKAKVFTTSSRIPLDSLLGGSQDLILVVDRDNRVVRINDQFLAILGKARSEILGKNISFLPVSDPSFEPVFAAIRSSLKSGHFDTELRVHAGNEQIFRQKIIPTVFDDGGQGMIVLLENITDRKVAEHSLRTSEEQFRLMAETIQDGIAIYRNGIVTYTNRRMEEIFGYSSEELSRLLPTDLAIPEERERVQEFLDAFSPTKTTPSEITFWMFRKDAVRRYISCRFTAAAHEDSLIRYIVITDMTEWKHAQDALENQLGFLQHMIDTFPNPLFYVDVEGRYLGCNSAFSRMTGTAIEDIAGRTNEEMGEPWQAELFGRYNEKLLDHPNVSVYRGIFRRGDGEQSLLTFQKSTMITRDGDVAGIVGIILVQEPVDTPVIP